MDQTVDVIIVGAGASGLTAGIQAARQGARVLILEHMDKAGKKILATGNGKCNFTNEKQGIAYYRGKNPAFVLPSLRQFRKPSGSSGNWASMGRQSGTGIITRPAGRRPPCWRCS